MYFQPTPHTICEAPSFQNDGRRGILMALKIRYTISQGALRKERVLIVADDFTIMQIIEKINDKNPGWRCVGWVRVKK